MHFKTLQTPLLERAFALGSRRYLVQRAGALEPFTKALQREKYKNEKLQISIYKL